MKKYFVPTLLVTLLSLLSCSHHKKNEPKLIYWNHPDSEIIFNRSIKRDFFKLSNHFEAQSNRVYCGPTTATIVLNALRSEKKDLLPLDKTVLMNSEKKYLPKNFEPSYPKYTQRNVFDSLKGSKAKSKLEVLGRLGKTGKPDFGLQIRQYAKFLEAHNLKVELVVMNDQVDDMKLKKRIIENLKNVDDYVLINYKRSGIGQKGGGHISPLAAYDSITDRFLIMDVFSLKYPWVWLKTADLFSGMKTFDTIENRGLVFVSDK